jgi:rubrerythrin
MSKEHDAALSGLKTAVQMEIDGKEFYLKISKESSNEAGKILLKQLASEEDIHRKVFERIYKDISANEGWPESKIDPDGVKRLKTVFSEAMKAMKNNPATFATELSSVQKAMDMENKTYDFYVSRSTKAAHNAEKKLYQEIALQEKEHHRVLLDYYDFIKDPASWYVQKEHTSVDGG